jgi:phospholipase/carboxylesterase
MQATEHQGKGLKYMAVEPDGFDRDHRYPLVILLHGFGASMLDLVSLCRSIHPSGYVYICPNAPLEVSVGAGMNGYAWMPPGDSRTPEDADRSDELLATLFDEVIDHYGVAPGQAILGGFSQGGMMTYRCGLTNPFTFRGLVVLSGRVPDADGLRSRLPPIRSQRIFVAHGAMDSLISVADARESRDFLKAEGYRPEYQEYAMGHEINNDVLGDLVSWVNDVLPPSVPTPATE